jgi:hypothetical protein
MRPELLGFRGDPKWRDMSDYLVHFTTQESLHSILSDGHLEARNEFGWFRSDSATSGLRVSACLSEVPIDQVDRLAARRGRYGIGFRALFMAVERLVIGSRSDLHRRWSGVGPGR